MTNLIFRIKIYWTSTAWCSHFRSITRTHKQMKREMRILNSNEFGNVLGPLVRSWQCFMYTIHTRGKGLNKYANNVERGARFWFWRTD